MQQVLIYVLVSMIPMTLLSGMTTPVANMPQVLQAFTYIDPMRFAIDAVYLDDDCRILKIAPRLLPWLGLSCCRGAWGCLELPAGAAARLGLAVGERLSEDA